MRKLKLHLVTSNPHKLAEIREIALSALGKLAEKLEIDMLPLEVEEMKLLGPEGFMVNSYLKAMMGYERVKEPCIADDSGLVIPALQELPGPLSARFLSEVSAAERNRAIASMMRELPEEMRRAYFQCSATLVISPSEAVTLSARVYGYIADEPRGDKGFGYDPIFIPDGYDETFAQLGPQVKNAISHRARAFFSLFEYIRERFACLLQG